ncbi:hypothetical protein FB45DRAFT_1126177 [Roridomyces roridus]|uniref:Xylanolytic transcriptional activator regulatory domain-containing protein n=1 Tax=Roridomyces roridus TaxID=1738132 RepID=A0AAD7FWR7_9AGAR|nr:hypothetical protein FB45DRAFT_1126177 [Roridomyces roridus]
MAGSSEQALQRGQAYTDEQRLALRWSVRDSATRFRFLRPKCGQCTRGRRLEDCEYTDNSNRTRAQRLEEDISRIESRIHQLENAAPAGESVILNHPYQPQNDWWVSPEPPSGVTKILESKRLIKDRLDNFLPYAFDWGFFLDPAAFRHSALLPHPIGHPARPSPPLLLAVCLIGIALSQSPSIRAHENTFLSRTLAALPVSLAGLHPQKALHALQAEVLLATYFFATERALEGKYHTAAAASLAVPVSVRNSRGQTLELVELDAYWTTVILDKSWAAALGTHPNIPDSDDMLRMKWPGQEDVFFIEPSTVSQFLDGTEEYTPVPSAKTVLAKAAFLWERAKKLVAHWTEGMTQQQASWFCAKFNLLDSRMQELQSITTVVGHGHENKAGFFMGRSIAYAATIQLHGTFASGNHNAESKRRCLEAAKGILSLVPEAGDLYSASSAFVNPIISTIWVSACEIAIDEIAAMRAIRLGWATPDDAETVVVSLLNNAMEVMKSKFQLGPGPWNLMRRDLTKIEQEYVGRLRLFEGGS